MRVFIVKFCSLCFIALLLSAVIEIALLYQPNIYSYKHQYVKNHRDNIKVLLMGNSLISYGLKPELIGPDVFNNAISGRPLDCDLELLKQYVPLLRGLKVVAIPVYYNDFYFKRGVYKKTEIQQKRSARSRRCMYFKYMGVDAPIWYWSELLNSQFGCMSRFVNSEKESIECDSLGYKMLTISMRDKIWQNIAVPLPIDMSRPKDMAEYHKLLKNYCTLAELTSEKGIRLLLLDTPKLNTYHDNMNKELLMEILDMIDMLKNKYPNVEYYDFSKNGDFVDDDFKDATHLTVSGAEKFSKLLKKVIDNP